MKSPGLHIRLTTRLAIAALAIAVPTLPGCQLFDSLSAALESTETRTAGGLKLSGVRQGERVVVSIHAPVKIDTSNELRHELMEEEPVAEMEAVGTTALTAAAITAGINFLGNELQGQLETVAQLYVAEYTGTASVNQFPVRITKATITDQAQNNLKEKLENEIREYETKQAKLDENSEGHEELKNKIEANNNLLLRIKDLEKSPLYLEPTYNNIRVVRLVKNTAGDERVGLDYQLALEFKLANKPDGSRSNYHAVILRPKSALVDFAATRVLYDHRPVEMQVKLQVYGMSWDEKTKKLVKVQLGEDFVHKFQASLGEQIKFAKNVEDLESRDGTSLDNVVGSDRSLGFFPIPTAGTPLTVVATVTETDPSKARKRIEKVKETVGELQPIIINTVLGENEGDS